MAKDCGILAPEDFVLEHISRANLREKYLQFAFQDYVKSHPQLRFCPGKNCSMVIYSKEVKAKKAVCTFCKTTFCFR